MLNLSALSCRLSELQDNPVTNTGCPLILPIRFCRNTPLPICLGIGSGCFNAIITELNSRNRNFVAHQAKNICYLALSGKNSLASAPLALLLSTQPTTSEWQFLIINHMFCLSSSYPLNVFESNPAKCFYTRK